MRIASVETRIVGNAWKNWLFVRVETDDGLHGYGEGTVNGFAATVAAAIEELSDQYLGADPHDVEALLQRMVRDVYSDGGQIHMAAAAAIEIACWDIVGKAAGLPVHALLGGRVRDRVRAYANGWYRTEREPDAVAAKAREVVAAGYTAMKFDPFGTAWRVQDRREEDLSIDIVRAVRDAVGPDVDLMIEAHNRFTASTALRIADRLAEFRPAWLEEPVHHSQLGSMVEVARRSPVPVATGESFTSLGQFADLLSHDVVQILQPEPLHLGGIWRTRQLASMAEAHLAVVAPHNAQGPVCGAVAVQLGACIPNFYVQETFDEFNADWTQGIVDRPIRPVEGYVEVPDAPGLGIELDWEALGEHPYRRQHLIRLFSPGWERRDDAPDGDGVTEAAGPDAFEPDELVEALVAAVPDAADRRDRIRVVRAPGRVNLIGEHTDYNLGFVLPAAIDLEIRIAYLPTDDGRVEMTRLGDGERDGFDLATDRPRSGTWLDYVAGTAWALGEAGHPRRGLRGIIASTLPTASGLSSSAAIELASAWALLDEAATSVDALTLARICQRAENVYVGVQCGLMDQFASSCGVDGAAVLLDCRSLEWRQVALPDGVVIVVLHTGSPRSLNASEYNARRSQCELAVAELARDDPTIASLRDVTMPVLEATQDRMDPIAYRRARHIVTENERVAETIDAFAAGDLAAVGRLFAASHDSLRDDFEVVSPELDAMVDIASSVPGVVAARMTGAGFGGCTVNLVRPAAVDALRAAVERDYPARTGLQPRVLPVMATAGAGRLR